MPLRLLSILLLSMLALGAPSQAADFETRARYAVVVDFESGQTLFEKDADRPIPTASMSKLMTIYMLLERIDSGALSLDDTFPVSAKAWKKGGSKMFVEVGKQVRVEDLLRGIIVQSGNDASIVVAEALAVVAANIFYMRLPKGRPRTGTWAWRRARLRHPRLCKRCETAFARESE